MASLLELIVSLSISSVLTGMSVHALSDLSHFHALKKESRHLEAFLAKGVTAALSLGSTASLERDAQGLILSVDSQHPQRYTPRHGSLRGTIKAQFYPSGAIKGGTFILEKGTHRCSVTLSLQGRTRRNCA